MASVIRLKPRHHHLEKQEGECARPVGLRAVSLGCDNGVSVQIRGEVVLGKT